MEHRHTWETTGQAKSLLQFKTEIPNYEDRGNMISSSIEGDMREYCKIKSQYKILMCPNMLTTLQLLQPVPKLEDSQYAPHYVLDTFTN